MFACTIPFLSSFLLPFPLRSVNKITSTNSVIKTPHGTVKVQFVEKNMGYVICDSIEKGSFSTQLNKFVVLFPKTLLQNRELLLLLLPRSN
ncbi:hypothetical protein MtrunA17_Chr5g0415311 [Medicago truncatula]|uniref:Uncharacterized protein n=1 Tax=Medicago truncatula TaxID=3880 RepID=A0A396HPE8_MEDTR|nr:hypothetical protein MtrunA17_Chr5g0415311 [Medicago truncatula]